MEWREEESPAFAFFGLSALSDLKANEPFTGNPKDYSVEGGRAVTSAVDF